MKPLRNVKHNVHIIPNARTSFTLPLTILNSTGMLLKAVRVRLPNTTKMKAVIANTIAIQDEDTTRNGVNAGFNC